MIPDNDESKISLQLDQIREIIHELNQLSLDQIEKKKVLLTKILNKIGEGTEIRAPVWLARK